MRLTVGSLPAAVYWRRRAIVLAVVLLVTVFVWISCATAGGSGGSKSAAAKKSVRPSTSASARQSTAAVTSPSAGSTPSLPAASGAVGPSPSVPPATSESPAVAAVGDPPSVCSDTEVQITPLPEQASVRSGTPMRLYIRIKNTSTRPCPRDLGADAQELYILQGNTKIYSSDACDAIRGTDVRTLAPGDEQEFRVPWDGLATSGGCNGRQALPAGKYLLIGRLGTKISDAVPLTIT
jgi:hypothetical protein